jgi:hypothetical protein
MASSGGLDFAFTHRYLHSPLLRHDYSLFATRYSPLSRYRAIRRQSMPGLRRHYLWCFVCLAAAMAPASASDTSFPFGRALLLDAAPLAGSKRVPMIEIEEDGSASIYLWCAGVRGSANVGNDTISITPTAPLPSHCTPDQISRDAALLVQLSQMTGWRRQADEIDLIGAVTLRFRLMTN